MKLGIVQIDSDGVILSIKESAALNTYAYDGNVNWSLRTSSNGAMTLEVTVTPRESATPRPMLPQNLGRR